MAMNDRVPDPAFERQLRALQITVGTLAAGSMAFAVIAIVMHSRGLQIALAAFPLLSIVAVVQAVALLIARPFFLSATLRSARQNLGDGDISDEQWMRIFSTLTMIGAALLEGGAFMFFIAYMLEGEWWTLAGGIAMVGLMCVWHFPVREKVAAWIEELRG